jgi:hypothetical protein
VHGSVNSADYRGRAILIGLMNDTSPMNRREMLDAGVYSVGLYYSHLESTSPYGGWDSYNLYIYETENGNWHTWEIDTGWWYSREYYCNFTYTGSQVIAEIYNSSDLTGLVASRTASLTLQGYTFSQIAALISSDQTGGYDSYRSSGFVEQLWIGATQAGATPKVGALDALSTVYANRFFWVNQTVSHPDGPSSIDYTIIELEYGVRLKWAESTDSFTEDQDTSGYCTLDMGGSTKLALNDSAVKLCYRLKLSWSYPETAVDVTSFLEADDATTDSKAFPDEFIFEDDLIVSAASADSRAGLGGSVVFTGTLHYQGTSTAPEDTIGISVYVSFVGVIKGSTSNIDSAGDFSVSVGSEASVGNCSYSVYAVTDESTMQNGTAYVAWDSLTVSSQVIDFDNAALYAMLVYTTDSAAISGGTVNFNGLEAQTNSSGWAEIDLTQASNFDWNTECYGVTDGSYGVTATGTNQTVALAKRSSHIIGGNAAAQSITWDGSHLNLEFNLSTGAYLTKITGSKPVYVTGCTYDLDTDYGAFLSLSHDGTETLNVAYGSWGGLHVGGLDHGHLTSVSLTGNTLVMVVNGSTGSGTLYVDCTGRNAPQQTEGFDETWWEASTNLFTGTYTLTLSKTFTLDFTVSEGGGGGTGEGTSGGGIQGGLLSVMLDITSLKADPGAQVESSIPVIWSGVTVMTVQSINFLEYADWFTPTELPPIRLSGSPGDTGTSMSGSIPIRAYPPSSAKPGNYTVPVELTLESTGGKTVYVNGFVKLSVNQPRLPTPSEGFIPNTVGYILGLGLLVSLIMAIWKRE